MRNATRVRRFSREKRLVRVALLVQTSIITELLSNPLIGDCNGSDGELQPFLRFDPFSASCAMHVQKHDQIQRCLSNLVKAHHATVETLEEVIRLLTEELQLDSIPYWQWRRQPYLEMVEATGLVIDDKQLAVRSGDRMCILGNTLLFHFFACLARRPNIYVTYDELFEVVWHGVRSDSAIRTVVKRLRTQLRRAGMADLAMAIDGSARGRYALRLP